MTVHFVEMSAEKKDIIYIDDVILQAIIKNET